MGDRPLFFYFSIAEMFLSEHYSVLLPKKEVHSTFAPILHSSTLNQKIHLKIHILFDISEKWTALW